MRIRLFTSKCLKAFGILMVVAMALVGHFYLPTLVKMAHQKQLDERYYVVDAPIKYYGPSRVEPGSGAVLRHGIVTYFFLNEKDEEVSGKIDWLFSEIDQSLPDSMALVYEDRHTGEVSIGSLNSAGGSFPILDVTPVRGWQTSVLTLLGGLIGYLCLLGCYELADKVITAPFHRKPKQQPKPHEMEDR